MIGLLFIFFLFVFLFVLLVKYVHDSELSGKCAAQGPPIKQNNTPVAVQGGSFGWVLGGNL